MILPSFLFTVLLVGAFANYIDDLYPDYSEEVLTGNGCDPSHCLAPNCSCFGVVPLKGDTKNLPQFVVLTFDDAVTTLNINTYRQLLKAKHNSNGCPVSATFFVSHEYNDYEFVNEVYKQGNDIAVHSITHESSTEMWKTASLNRWKDEMTGMRQILSKFGLIPSSEILGHRAPFLQSSGDSTFEMLKENQFVYDSSMPSRAFMDPPAWPYTLDHGFLQDCQIPPCPKSSYPGLWLFPMVQWKRTSVIRNEVIDFHCSMLDACTPYPTTAKETYAYMMDNFERHYTSNKAPFPVFLHEALEGFANFLDAMRQKEDVFIVSMREVLEYMKHPVKLEEYKSQKCFASTRPQAGACKPVTCNFRKRNIFMKSCVPCPKRFPWLGNPEGQIQQ
ncbi:nodB homology domain-containing protein [Caerostris extrusa]|uniref:NodB homology domain-containing protein n=1 Tax=Caerostris extrusa TaxID=172846 RepID=A0AAV4RPX4_CAEEX|nr:nodB homology domain-containing protein [Caerostris extrusa]